MVPILKSVHQKNGKQTWIDHPSAFNEEPRLVSRITLDSELQEPSQVITLFQNKTFVINSRNRMEKCHFQNLLS